MKAALICGPRGIRVESVADPWILVPSDALVRVVASCVCGTDLWPYRGVVPTNEPRRMGYEFVGTKESIEQAIDVTRPGGAELPIGQIVSDNIDVAGGLAPVRVYLSERLPDVLAGRITPGPVFDLERQLEEAAEAHAAMDKRRAIKTVLRP